MSYYAPVHRVKQLGMGWKLSYIVYMSCIFCRIIDKESPSKVYYEDDSIIVFADIIPRAKIHLLIVPKEHFERLVELPERLILKSVETANNIARKLKIEDNFRLILNNGALAGQIVDHLHFHFMSNAPGVEIKYLEQVVK